MYKTVSINNRTYQQLHALSKKLNKPKSQLIEDLITNFINQMHEDEKNTLRTFNASIKRLSTKVKLPKGTTINTTNLDEAFEVLREKEKNS